MQIGNVKQKRELTLFGFFLLSQSTIGRLTFSKRLCPEIILVRRTYAAVATLSEHKYYSSRKLV